MEKIKINLEDVNLEIPINKVKELAKNLSMDEIVDALIVDNQIHSLIERLCMDCSEEIASLLNDFFNHKSDANKYLMANEQEDLQNEYEKYLSNRYKNI